jgi:hypothetical protein
VSDDVQWLIDHGHIGADEIVDETATTYQYTGVVDPLEEALDTARRVFLGPWAPEPVPMILCEGANDLGVVATIGRELRCQWSALGGHGRAQHAP